MRVRQDHGTLALDIRRAHIGRRLRHIEPQAGEHLGLVEALVRHDHAVVEDHEQGVRVELPEDDAGDLVQPVVHGEEEDQVDGGGDGGECACFDGEADNWRWG